MSNPIHTDCNPIATPPAGNKGTGPGQYDGLSGLPGRTPSPNAVPERITDENPPIPTDKISK